VPFPYTFYSNFETFEAVKEWDSESDTGTRLDVVNYAALSGMPQSSAVPWQGAHCVRIVLGDTNDHTLTEGDVNIASASEAWQRFYVNVVELSTTAQDIFPILELQSPTSNTVRTGVYLRSDFTGGATTYYQIGVGGNQGGAAYLGTQLQTNRWHCLELSAKPANLPNEGDALGRQDNGAATLYVNGNLNVATSAIIMTGGADASIGQAVLGTQDTVSTTTGTILLDEFIADDARLYPALGRWETTRLLVATDFAFVGPGVIDNVKLLSGAATDNRLTVLDTDRATGYLAANARVITILRNTANNETVDPADMPASVSKGCYVILEGTNPRALVKLCRAPAHSQAGMKRLGLVRRSWSGEVL